MPACRVRLAPVMRARLAVMNIRRRFAGAPLTALFPHRPLR
ncbi:hypothetical protein GLA29479_2258 [Lysobacter antibioticus]|nr:hypothetical protein GLA29479_2258 [Lysobacter antibioticus]